MELVIAPNPIADFKVRTLFIENGSQELIDTYENKIKKLHDKINNLLDKLEKLKRPMCSRKRRKIKKPKYLFDEHRYYGDLFKKEQSH